MCFQLIVPNTHNFPAFRAGRGLPFRGQAPKHVIFTSLAVERPLEAAVSLNGLTARDLRHRWHRQWLENSVNEFGNFLSMFRSVKFIFVLRFLLLSAFRWRKFTILGL